MKNILRLITLSSLVTLVTACGGQSDDPRTADTTASLSGSESGEMTASNQDARGDSAGDGETVGVDGSAGDGADGNAGGGVDGNVGGGVDGNAGGGVDGNAGGDGDPNTGVSDDPGSNPPGSPGGGVDPVAPSCVADFDPRAGAGDSPCNFVAGGVCFADGADACACAGCVEDECIILESYPAQARCQ